MASSSASGESPSGEVLMPVLSPVAPDREAEIRSDGPDELEDSDSDESTPYGSAGENEADSVEEPDFESYNNEVLHRSSRTTSTRVLPRRLLEEVLIFQRKDEELRNL